MPGTCRRRLSRWLSCGRALASWSAPLSPGRSATASAAAPLLLASLRRLDRHAEPKALFDWNWPQRRLCVGGHFGRRVGAATLAGDIHHGDPHGAPFGGFIGGLLVSLL